MFKVKIDAVGWDSFTGLLGTVPFENGVSTREVTPQEAARLGASLRIVKVGTDEQVGVAVSMASSRHVSAEVKVVTPPAKEQPKEVVLTHDRNLLEEIASEGGIKAIREVGKEYGVKGVEIMKMIEDIIAAQMPKEE